MNVDTKQLATALNAVLPSVCKDATRPHMHAVLFAHETENETERLALAATDGHRLVKVSIPAEHEDEAWGSLSVTAHEAKRMLLNIKLASKKEDRIELVAFPKGVEVGRFGLFLCEREAAPFPSIHKVIPPLKLPKKGVPVPVAIDPGYFIDAAEVFVAVDGRGSCMIMQPVLDAVKPLRFDSDISPIQTTVVIMPKRV